MTNLSSEAKGTVLGTPIPPPPVMRHIHTAFETPVDNESQGSSQSIAEDHFFKLLTGIIGRNIRNLPDYLKKNLVWLGPLLIVWLVLWVNPRQMPLGLNLILGAIQNSPFAGLIIFLTATYNGAIAKAFYIGIVSGTLIPIVKQLKQGQWPQLISKYRQVISIIKQAMSFRQKETLPNLLLFGGAGLAFSNLLTRNNGIDKYFICLLLSFSIFHALSRGTRDMVVRLFSAGYSGILSLFGKSKRPSLKLIYLALSGFALGTSLNFIPGFFKQNWTEPHGYIFGGILMAAGVVLLMSKGKSHENTQPR